MSQKIQNIITSAVTWITAASVALAQVASEIEGMSPAVAQIVASAVAVIAIIRRVTPVSKEERGLS